MPRSITLSREQQRVQDPSREDSFRVRVTVTSATGVSPAIFVHNTRPLLSGQTEPFAEFSHVATPVDLAELPAGMPLPGASPPWFRLDTIDVLLRSRQEATEFLEAVALDVDRLLESLKRNDELGSLPPLTIED